jgi:ATP synthase protein I
MTTARATSVAGYQTTTVISVVRGALVATALVGLAAALLAALVAGWSAALGALVATGMVCVFFAFGAMVLAVVSSLAPAASLLIALLTYTLKVVLIGLVFVVLSRSGALEETIDGQWLGGVAIVCTLVWLATQIFYSVRARQPVYDLPSRDEEASDR